MAESQAWRAGRIRQANYEAAAAGGGERHRHGAGARLRALLHAPALLSGAAGNRHDVTFIEDDYRRLAARRAR